MGVSRILGQMSHRSFPAKSLIRRSFPTDVIEPGRLGLGLRAQGYKPLLSNCSRASSVASRKALHSHRL